MRVQPRGFVAAADGDDDLVPPARSSATFTRWRAADRAAGLHPVEQAGHGFSMQTQHWRVGFEAWLRADGGLTRTCR